MIAGSRVLLLVTGLMLLVNNDKAQVLERQEHRRTGSQYHVVRVLRELFLPYFHALCIRIPGMVNTQPIAKHALQSLHHLHRQRYLRQQIEHLLFLFQSPLDEVYVNLRLTARRHAMQQCHITLHHRHQDGIVGILLRPAQRLDEVWTILAAVIQSSYLHFVGLQHLALLQLLQRLSGGATGIHQLLPCNLLYLCTELVIIITNS